MHEASTRRFVAGGAVFVMVVASCGGNSDDDTTDATDETVATDETTVGTDAPDEGLTPEPDATQPVATESTSDTVLAAGAEAADDVDTEVVENTDERVVGGHVIMGIEAETAGLRPWEDICTQGCSNMARAVFDTLVEQRADGTYGPFLAESVVPNADFTEWTVTLRPDVVFHNGVPLVAQTLADMFAIQQTGATSAGQIAGAKLETVTATDDLTVAYSLAAPDAVFPSRLQTLQLGAVFEPGDAAADPAGFADAPVGTGPFVIEDRDPDNFTRIVRNDDYWMTDEAGQPLPYLDSVEFRPIPDEGTRLDSLLSDTIDVMHTLRQGTVRDARDAAGSDFTLYEHQGNNAGGGIFNVTIPPLDDLRVRLGLTMMNNQDAVIEALGGTGISLPATQWFSPDSPWYSEAVAAAWPAFDYEGGKALVQEYIDDPARSDGRAPGEKISFQLGCPPDPSLVAAMQVLEQLWSESGIVDVELTSLDQQSHVAQAIGAPPDFLGAHEVHCWRMGSDNDPASYINNIMAPPNETVAAAHGYEGQSSPTNFSNYFDPELYQALLDAAATSDFDERYALYESVMMNIAENVPVYYSGHTATMIASDDDVLGFNSWTLPDGTLGIGHPGSVGRFGQVWVAA